jgi:hypothetical protein
MPQQDSTAQEGTLAQDVRGQRPGTGDARRLPAPPRSAHHSVSASGVERAFSSRGRTVPDSRQPSKFSSHRERAKKSS